MTDLDELQNEEGRQVALDLKESTMKLVRMFSIDENQKKLKASIFHKPSTDYLSLMSTMTDLELLYGQMLGTPKEEKQAIDENVKVLTQRIEALN